VGGGEERSRLGAHMCKALEDLRASREILDWNIRGFHSGKKAMYRVIAGELRKLLCDFDKRGCKYKDKSLLPRVFGEVKLHPVIGYRSGILEILGKNAFIIPAMMSSNGKGGSQIEALFDETKERIDLDEWRKQPLFSEGITVLELIESVAVKEAAHSDKNNNLTLRLVKKWKFPDEDVYAGVIVTIGEYILSYICDKSKERIDV
jgi:hypothetical protein